MCCARACFPPATVSLKITYTPTYPDELPVFELADLEGLPAEKLAELTARVTEEVCPWPRH